MNLMSLTAVELGKKIKSGEVTAVDATKAALEQIKKLDGTYNCYRTHCTYPKIKKTMVTSPNNAISGNGKNAISVTYTVMLPPIR